MPSAYFVFLSRLGWATPKNSLAAQLQPKLDTSNKNRATAQIHISFISKQINFLVTEATLRNLFERFGTVDDVTIKKSHFDQKHKVQNGYGFVHFSLDLDGIRAAVFATQTIQQVTINQVTYDSCLTRSLEAYILHLGTVPIQEAERVPIPPHMVGADLTQLLDYLPEVAPTQSTPMYKNPSAFSLHPQQAQQSHQFSTFQPTNLPAAPTFDAFKQKPQQQSLGISHEFTRRPNLSLNFPQVSPSASSSNPFSTYDIPEPNYDSSFFPSPVQSQGGQRQLSTNSNYSLFSTYSSSSLASSTTAPERRHSTISNASTGSSFAPHSNSNDFIFGMEDTFDQLNLLA